MVFGTRKRQKSLRVQLADAGGIRGQRLSGGGRKIASREKALTTFGP